MIKNNFLVIRLKRIILPFIFCVFTLCLILFSRTNISAAKDGLMLWANSVVPSLLPFFIATNLLSFTDIPKILGKLLNTIMRPLFNVPGEGAFAFIMGIISGYPIGAKIVSGFKQDGICTNEEAERLLAFTNNSGPLFIIGTVGVGFFADSRTGFLLFLTHLLACVSVGIIFRWWKIGSQKSEGRGQRIYVGAGLVPAQKTQISKSNGNPHHKSPITSTVSFNNLGEVLGTSIMNAINTVVMIGGFVVLFSVIVSMLNQGKVFDMISSVLKPLNIQSEYIKGALTGMIELTNGLRQISVIPNKIISINIVICAFLLGFGGISVLLQVLSITSKANISIKPYIIGKLLHGALAAFYTYLILKHSAFFSLDISPVISSNAYRLNTAHTNYLFLLILVLISLACIRRLLKKA